MQPRRFALAALPLLLLAGCGPLAPAPLGRLEGATPPPSPEVRDQRNRLDIQYHLNTPATVSSRIVSTAGTGEWVLHANAVRPTAGDYVLQFDGTVAGPGPNERRVLPDGDYQVRVEVTSGGQQQQGQVPLSVRDADTTPPDVTDLTLLPDRISPNFDARDDVTHVTYRLAKDARIAPYLDAKTPSGTTQRVWMGEETRVLAGEQSLTWDGLANGQPMVDGDYVLGIRARDQAGNVVERGTRLVIEDSGVPDASILTAHIGPLQMIRGGQVCLEAIVRNTGQTVLRTEGPDPGYVYNSLDTYASIADHAFAEHAGYWRIGLSWSGSTETNGATYPYRWGFGHDLQPGEEATVHGCVTVLNEQDRLVFFAGLVQENVAIRSPGAGLVRVQISS
ncbi:MAG TPA: hypothetical protein VGQ62_04835 [Chloroflexota bacterium]|nr:hypothetical protein [Chloroflexota bacterium]